MEVDGIGSAGRGQGWSQSLYGQVGNLDVDSIIAAIR